MSRREPLTRYRIDNLNDTQPLPGRRSTHVKASRCCCPVCFLGLARSVAWAAEAPLNKMSYANVEKYMRRCAFFGFFPSMFSADAFHDRYFDDPKYYDRDRPLFKKYLPVILDMSQAGWCPITHARCPETAIRLERFGTGSTVFLSVLNTDKEQTHRAVVSVDKAAMGLGEGTIEASELFSGQTIPFSDGTVSSRPGTG